MSFSLVCLGWVEVTWDHGGSNSYRMGAEDKYDLQLVEESLREGSQELEESSGEVEPPSVGATPTVTQQSRGTISSDTQSNPHLVSSDNMLVEASLQDPLNPINLPLPPGAVGGEYLPPDLGLPVPDQEYLRDVDHEEREEYLDRWEARLRKLGMKLFMEADNDEEDEEEDVSRAKYT